MKKLTRTLQGALATIAVAVSGLAVAAPAQAAGEDCALSRLVAENVTTSSAELSWSAVPGTSSSATRFVVRGLSAGDRFEYSTSSMEVGIGGFASSHNVTISVTPVCSTGGVEQSGQARTVTFATLGDIGGVRETSTDVKGPGDGFYRLVNAAGEAFSKSTSCAVGDGGPVVNAARDVSKFSQQWKFMKQPNGNYVIASLCQPTVLLTAHPAPLGHGAYSFEYGGAGRQGELGDWNPSYEYNVAHTPAQEWEVKVNGDGTVTLTNWGAGQSIAGFRLESV